MKGLKFLMAGCLFASLVAVTVVKINFEYSEADNRDFILTNSEILAQGEGGDADCTGTGSIICGGGTYKVRVN